jgi:orotidine-5'-phosphate decarboxylase
VAYQTFLQHVIDSTADLVGMYLIDPSYYPSVTGSQLLESLVDYLRQQAPQVPVVLDARRANGRTANHAYASYAFDHLGVHGVTVCPYAGVRAALPFLERSDRGVFVVCQTEEPNRSEVLEDSALYYGTQPLYHAIARSVGGGAWHAYGNCGLLAVTMRLDEVAWMREMLGPELPMIVANIDVLSAEPAVCLWAATRDGSPAVLVSHELINAGTSDDFHHQIRAATEDLILELRRTL